MVPPVEGSELQRLGRLLRLPTLSALSATGQRRGVQPRSPPRGGLEPEFIAQLELFARSKGRTPQVFLFNPLAEGYIARGLGFTPAAPARQLARDLAHLPQFLARRDDVVVVPEAPAPDFLATLKSAGFELPEFVVAPEGVRLGNGHGNGLGHGLTDLLGERKLGVCAPGPGPRIAWNVWARCSRK